MQIVDTLSPSGRRLIWDEENVLLETSDAGATEIVFTYEPAGYGKLISHRHGSTSRYYLFDALGSTDRLIDSAGTTSLATYRYRAYGLIAGATGASTRNPFRWVGELGYYYDVNRLSHYIRARTYNPRFARWLSRDPLGLAPLFFRAHANFYTYSASNPLRWVDPSGYEKCCIKSVTHCATTLDPFWDTVEIPDPTDPKRKIKSHRLLAEHAFKIVFEEDACGDCSCKCCAVEQWIKGYSRLTDPDGKVLVDSKPKLIGSGKQLDPKEFRQDSKRFKPSPCTLDFLDSPGIGVTNFARINGQYFHADVNFSFEIRVFDVCNDDKVIKTYAHTMAIKGPLAKPSVKTSLKKCSEEFLKEINWPGLPKG